VIGQYYNFLRLGREGYREVMMNAMQNAAYLRKALEDTGKVRPRRMDWRACVGA
jgi:glutamate decarboxylase